MDITTTVTVVVAVDDYFGSQAINRLPVNKRGSLLRPPLFALSMKKVLRETGF